MIALLQALFALLLPLRAVVCPDGVEVVRYLDPIRVGCVVAADPVWRWRDAYLVGGLSVPATVEGLLLAIGDRLPERECARCVAWLE